MTTFFCIFVIFYIVLHIKFRPSIDITEEDKWLLWYNIKGKTSKETYRDYIELF